MSKDPLRLALSGGLANVTSSASLGGQLSSAIGGVVTPQSAVYAGGTLAPGIYIIGGSGLPTGLGEVSWVAASNTLSWEDADTVSVAIACNSTGYYRINYASTKNLLVYVDTAHTPAVDTSFNIYISSSLQRVFSNVPYAARSLLFKRYRCLYVQNISGGVLNGVTVSVSHTGYGGVTVGSEFPSGTQDTDGITGDLPYTLVDQQDSTDLLSGISWGSSVACGSIAPSKSVSFWLKYELPAASSGTSQETEDFIISIDYTRVL